MRERSVDWIVVEGGRVKVWEETPKREKELRFGIKNNIWDLGLCYSTLIYLGWYCSKLVNFFRFTILNVGWFWSFNAKSSLHIPFGSPNGNVLTNTLKAMVNNSFKKGFIGKEKKSN